MSGPSRDFNEVTRSTASQSLLLHRNNRPAKRAKTKAKPNMMAVGIKILPISSPDTAAETPSMRWRIGKGQGHGLQPVRHTGDRVEGSERKAIGNTMELAMAAPASGEGA